MALIDLLKIINHQVTTVKGRTPITGYELNRILNEIAVFANTGGGGAGNGIYGGSGSLSGPTLVTTGTNDLTFAGNQRIILDGTTLLQLGSLAGNVIRDLGGNLKIEALAAAGSDLTLDASQNILINGILSASITGASNALVLNAIANTFTDITNSKGIVYGADYSANFTVRSLVDKNYVDNAIPITSLANSTTLIEVSQESDFGTLVGNTRTLAANTTYLIRGIINCTNLLAITNAGTSITGFDRDRDGLTYSGANGLGDFITVTDVNTEFLNIKFSSTNSTGGDVVLRASNFNYGTFNDGRLKVLTMINCQFRTCYDVHHIEGFDLVDIQNTLFWYIEATTMGCHFKNVSKLQISSCEYVRWFREGTIPTPGGYATAPLIELLANGLGNGFGAVNISGSILHPQQTQDGLNISATSTTGFGTISGNTFINIGLTTGLVSNFDYDVQNAYIIQANQGLINGNAKGTLSIVGNLNNLNTGTTNPQVLNETNVGGSFTNAPTFPVANRVTTSVPNCSFTYNNKNNGNFFVVITGTVEMSGDGFIACRVRSNGVPIPFSIGYPEIRQGRAQNFSFSVIGSAVVGDVFDVEFEAFTTAGVPQLNDILVREFVLNGYQF